MSRKLALFLQGMGRSLDLFGRASRIRRPRPTSVQEAFIQDASALAGDWQKIGGDLRTAMIAETDGLRKGRNRKAG